MSVKRSPFCKMRLRLKFILADAALQAIIKFQKLIRLNIHQRHGKSPLYSTPPTYAFIVFSKNVVQLGIAQVDVCFMQSYVSQLWFYVVNVLRYFKIVQLINKAVFWSLEYQHISKNLGQDQSYEKIETLLRLKKKWFLLKVFFVRKWRCTNYITKQTNKHIP